MITIYTRYNRPPREREKNSGEYLIDDTGYLSVEQQITAMMLAGHNLASIRSDDYDFPDGEDTGYLDPTVTATFDEVEAQDLINDLNDMRSERLSESQEQKTEVVPPVSESGKTPNHDDLG